MKNLIILFFLLGAGLMLNSCNNQSKSTDKDSNGEVVEMSGPEYTSAYVCPMHCKGSGSDAAGSCPVCNMDYVENTKHQADGHIHDEESHDEH